MMLIPAFTACIALPGQTLWAKGKTPIAYPTAPRSDQVDDFHGVKVADPFRPLEDPDTEASRAWIEAENKITFNYLESIPQRGAIKKRLTKLWDYEKFGQPYKEGGRYFMTKNDGLQNHSVVYWAPSLSSTPKVLFDPNKLSKDGTVALSGWRISDDGKLMAYGISASGSDWKELRVREVDTGKDLSDHIKWVKFSSAAWTKDSKGFFYSRYDEPKEGAALKQANYFQKLYYHRLGTDQSQDELVYERKDHKDWGFGGSVTEDGRYLIISVWKGTARKNLVFYKDLTQDNSKIVELIGEFESFYNFVGNDGPLFWFQTDHNAPRNRLIAIDIRSPDRKSWIEVIPESKDAMRWIKLVGNKFAVPYLKDAITQIKIFDLKGNFVRDVKFPGLGSTSGFWGKRDDPETFYTYTSYSTPPTIYRYDMNTGKSEIYRQPKVAFNPDDYTSKQIFYASKDGTRIPMIINHKKGLKIDGNTPTILYGYGGFNASITPRFSVSNLAWMEMGGIYAVPNIRGGGEYGKAWHEAGMKLVKQNVFDDFIAAAEWLIDNQYTRTEKLAISGRSNGGLLVGACMTQRPDLFGACLPGVGVMDMLRFHKFTIGWAWTSDYGSPDNPEEFKALYAYSPLHNLKPGTAYPATLITTADHDDRVFPAHSFKFAARLQEVQSGPEPVMIRIETKAGHGSGKPTTMRIEEAADTLSFLVRELEMDVKP